MFQKLLTKDLKTGINSVLYPLNQVIDRTSGCSPRVVVKIKSKPQLQQHFGKNVKTQSVNTQNEHFLEFHSVVFSIAENY